MSSHKTEQTISGNIDTLEQACRFAFGQMQLQIKQDSGNKFVANEKINMLYSRSDYASDKKWTRKITSETHKYPVAYSVNRANEVKLIWSELNNKGHYGLPKVIFGSGATGFVIDESGQYACSEFCTGIVDDVENLESIKSVLNSARFKDIILATSVSKAEINRKILKYFRKDFWKEFIDKPANTNIEFIMDEEDV